MRECLWVACVAMTAGTMLSMNASAQITFGQIDDFQTNNNPLGWIRGVNSPQLPFVVDTGGPQGNDAFLQNNSTGTTGSNSRMSMFNQQQWTGDYLDAGVTLITAEMADFGSTPLYMRIAIEDDFGTEWGSTNADFLPADGHWYPISFDMTASGLTLLQGSAPLTHSLANVGILRLVSNAEGPSFRGDVLQGALGIDEVAAVPEPELPAFVGALLAALRCRRRRVSRGH
jgi:hypothetical protein